MDIILTLSEVKAFLRIQENCVDEDSTLQLLMGASEEYLKNATGQIHSSTNPLAKLFCLVLVADWYENREMMGKGDEVVRHTMGNILNQLTTTTL